MTQPRAHRRHRRRYRVSFGPVLAYTIDVSAGGLCAEAVRVLPLATPVDGRLDVAGTSIPFKGVVAWVARGDWHLNLHGRMGVRFTRIGADLERLLEPQAGAAGA
ncbi:MAG TPA: PilZ domain-containing protein [Anaeromyxobacter sp.]|nr:PilZ domain-containing protein [Anaeromyxobacter sp.]